MRSRSPPLAPPRAPRRGPWGRPSDAGARSDEPGSAPRRRAGTARTPRGSLDAMPDPRPPMRGAAARTLVLAVVALVVLVAGALWLLRDTAGPRAVSQGLA